MKTNDFFGDTHLAARSKTYLGFPTDLKDRYRFFSLENLIGYNLTGVELCSQQCGVSMQNFLSKLAVKKPRFEVSSTMSVFGVLAIMKNEALNLSEWLDHYFWIGADRIFLIDNGSTDDTLSVLDRHPMRHRVELVVKPEKHRQIEHYREAYEDFEIAKKLDWLILVDLDEFLFVKSGASLAKGLRKEVRSDVLYVSWKNFGSNGIVAHPKSLREDLTQCCPNLGPPSGTRLGKWIARTATLKPEMIEVHHVVDMDWDRKRYCNNTLQLNHYINQSREFYESVKMVRGDAKETQWDSLRSWREFDRIEQLSTDTDTLLRDLLRK